MVLTEGVEPSCPKAAASKATVYTSSTTSAWSIESTYPYRKPVLRQNIIYPRFIRIPEHGIVTTRYPIDQARPLEAVQGC